jgi:leucyl-tRNA synthetase
VRLYTLFIGPPEKDAEWSDRGVEGAYRFLGRVWRLVGKVNERRTTNDERRISDHSKEDQSLRRKIHQTIMKVTEDLDGGFHFNTAISAVMELVNETYERISQLPEGAGVEGVVADGISATVMLLSPFVPHIAEEMWQKLGKSGSIFRASWPSFDKSALAQDTITMVIQVNGKVRSKIEIPADMSQEKVKEAALSDPKVQQHIKDKAVRQVVVVPKKLVNIVA